MKSKIDLRIYAKEVRKTLDIKLISQELVSLIRQSDIYQSAQNVMIYYPKKDEIDLRALLSDDKMFYLPKMDNENLLVCPYSEELEKVKYDIMEPCTKPVSCDKIDLVIVPALMVDRQGYRLGYGGGYYDRFLKSCKASTLVVVPNLLFVDELPYDEFDIKIDKIIVT